MKRREFFNPVMAAGLAAIALLLIAGCGSDRASGPIGPDPVSDEPGFLSPGDGAAPAVVLGRGDNGRGKELVPGSGPSNFVFVLNRATARIDGAVGGTLTCGRFQLTLPPGAFAGNRVITILDTSWPFVECRLLPEGLQFDVPVTLAVDLRNTTGDSPTTTVFWFDPSQPLNSWVDVGSSYVAASHLVVTQLHHFSTYRPGSGGRVGW